MTAPIDTDELLPFASWQEAFEFFRSRGYSPDDAAFLASRAYSTKVRFYESQNLHKPTDR